MTVWLAEYITHDGATTLGVYASAEGAKRSAEAYHDDVEKPLTWCMVEGSWIAEVDSYVQYAAQLWTVEP